MSHDDGPMVVETECPACGAIGEGQPGEACDFCDDGTLEATDDDVDGLKDEPTTETVDGEPADDQKEPEVLKVDVDAADPEPLTFAHKGETIVLVGCGTAKREGEHVAERLYTSTYFQKKREYAEAIADRWYILSAEYGLLAPDEVVESYDTHIDEVDAEAWADDVSEALPPLTGATVEVLAGPDYIDALDLTRSIEADEVRYPTEGMRIGERMQWLDEHTPDDQNDGSAGSVDQAANPVAVDGGGRDHDRDIPDERPEPPAEIAEYVLKGLARQPPEKLRTIAEYAEQLAAWEEQGAVDQADSNEDQEQDADDVVAEREAVDDERPNGVPGKASVVVKEIDGNRYEYWQWWEDGGTKSQYKGPVSSE